MSVVWEPVDIVLKAADIHDWWTFPVTADFTHEETGTRLTLEGFWNGERDWVIRFAPTLVGMWVYETISDDVGLNAQTGQVVVDDVDDAQIAQNPVCRGHVRVHDDGRYFEFADGTPFLLLADTLWAGNTARCGLGAQEAGPFFTYLKDRIEKGFTAILMQHMRGFGDTNTEAAGQRNEGGHPFQAGNVALLNVDFFRYLDVRLDAIRSYGLVAVMPVTWWGKMKNSFFTLDWAKRISAYLMVRYGAHNLIWSLSGEYQYAMHDCGWSEDDLDALGQVVDVHNVYRHPMSIHPSGRVNWDPPHNVQSSRPFYDCDWHDHTWLQTGQPLPMMQAVVQRSLEASAWTPPQPVFCSEASYERISDTDHAYHARWQAWSAFLNGALGGYGYGAMGMWQFFDPHDLTGETGKKVAEAIPWQEAMAFEGSTQVGYVGRVLKMIDWWRLVPYRDRLVVNGAENKLPEAEDLTPPHCAAVVGDVYVVYMPRGNAGRSIVLTELENGTYDWEWVNPRSGEKILGDDISVDANTWLVPNRPDDEDWICLFIRK